MPFKALIAVLLLVAGPIGAQSTPPRPDELKRTTPRSSIYSFLEACHQERFVLASRYLDLRGIRAADRAVKGPELAKQLEALLDSDPRFELQQLSDRPEGNTEDGLAPDRDALIGLQLNGSEVKLDLKRITQQGASVWLVSEQSVELIPDLGALGTESAIEKRLPLVLVKTQFLGTPLWSWLAMVLLALILSLLSRWLSRLVIKVLRPLAKRYANTLQAHRLEMLVEPLRLLVSV
ncbi:MAG TPA: hypothetical protein VK493_06525, partial [Bryobacteraceae bacterium]|nr:hypothetical protein [Bryobacteraceae bacterium]